MAAGAANAVPTAVGAAAFASAPIDANVAEDVEITDQLPGLIFSDGLFGIGFFTSLLPGGGPLVTSNFAETCGCSDIAVTLSSPAVRFGMVIATENENDTTLTLFSGATNLGSLTYTTGLDGVFIGIEELSGFDMVAIDVTGPSTSTAAFIADLFRFDLRADARAAPEPATFALLGALLGLAGLRRRRKEA